MTPTYNAKLRVAAIITFRARGGPLVVRANGGDFTAARAFLRRFGSRFGGTDLWINPAIATWGAARFIKLLNITNAAATVRVDEDEVGDAS